MKDFIKYNKNYIITGILVIVIIIASIIIGTRLSNKKEKSKEPTIVEEDFTVDKNLVLFGANTITLNYNDKYQEPGYYAINEKGDLQTNLVKVIEDINTSKPGEYTITYKYDDIEKTRTVIVLAKEDEPQPDPTPTPDPTPKPEEPTYDSNLLNISLKGEQTIKLTTEEKYNEPGYTASYNEIDLTDKVTVTSNYIEGKSGNYTITYTIDYQGIKKQIIRGIVVISSNINVSLSTETSSFTKDSVSIKVVSTGSSFSYIKLPNGKTSKSKKIKYNVSKNGTYTFTAYNTSNKEYTKSITINNIDKESPTGKCEATLNNNNTIINVNAKDSLSGIKNYIYKDSNNTLTTLSTNSYTHNKKTSKNISVQVVDKVGNSTNITCKVIDNSYYPVIKPNNDENIIKQEETDTLKVYITKNNNYYLTRIWTIDPYHQMNKEDSPNYGQELYLPSKLLNNAMNNNNLQDKLLIGFNASGFYLRNKYDSSSVNYYSGYNKTSVGTLVITNGNVKRNLYSKGDLLTWFITGITPDNKMVVFEDIKMKQTNVNEKKAWSEKVINSGIRNTYTFAAPVILNGQKTNYTNKNSRMPENNDKKLGLQLICQINDNNFALFTTNSSTRNTAINLFMKLGCKTAVNLDGGGSIALFFKSSTSNNIEKIVGDKRDLPEVGYFTEK